MLFLNREIVLWEIYGISINMILCNIIALYVKGISKMCLHNATTIFGDYQFNALMQNTFYRFSSKWWTMFTTLHFLLSLTISEVKWWHLRKMIEFSKLHYWLKRGSISYWLAMEWENMSSKTNLSNPFITCLSSFYLLRILQKYIFPNVFDFN